MNKVKTVHSKNLGNPFSFCYHFTKILQLQNAYVICNSSFPSEINVLCIIINSVAVYHYDALCPE